MSKTQGETTHVVHPFCRLLTERGWMLSNINPGEFTDSMPDKHACHVDYGERWIEFKIWKGIHNNQLSTSGVQKKRFPKLMANGMKIWCIIAVDLRGEANYQLRLHLYKKLFKEPNGDMMFNKHLWSLLK